MINQHTRQDVLQNEFTTFNCLRRVMIVGPQCLLEEGVTHLLTTKKNLEVFRAGGCDPNLLLEEIIQIHPDVVVLCHVDPNVEMSLLKMLNSVIALANLRTIIVEEQNIALQVCQCQQWFSALHTDFFPLVFGEITSSIQA